METDERRVYELGYHMVSTLSEEELQNELNSLRDEIKKLEGNFIAEGEPALIELAYTMYINEGGKNTSFDKAYFGWMKFDLDPSQLAHLKDEVIMENKNILRYLLFKTVAEDTRAQVNLEELKEVKNTDTLAPAPKAEKPEEDEKKSEEEKKEADADLDETIDKLLEE
jgi:ribosomal protein S6